MNRSDCRHVPVCHRERLGLRVFSPNTGRAEGLSRLFDIAGFRRVAIDNKLPPKAGEGKPRFGE
jgi:hypothetical protein